MICGHKKAHKYQDKKPSGAPDIYRVRHCSRPPCSGLKCPAEEKEEGRRKKKKIKGQETEREKEKKKEKRKKKKEKKKKKNM